MKVLVGIDSAGHFQPALDLLKRLDFPGLEVTLAHSIDAVPPLPAIGVGEAAFGVDLAESSRLAGYGCLERALARARELEIRAETTLLAGAPGPALIECSDREGADLVAIHSVPKGVIGNMLIGNVPRSLAIGSHRSVLISKGAPAAQGSLSSVFATDHSDYAAQALDALLRFSPKGISAIHVLSAASMHDIDRFAARFGSGAPSANVADWLKGELEARNEAVAARLRNAGYEATSSVVVDAPGPAIESTMRVQAADLLVMGAQGHGFIHRLVIGSVSLHQIVAQSYPVLLLRPKA